MLRRSDALGQLFHMIKCVWTNFTPGWDVCLSTTGHQATGFCRAQGRSGAPGKERLRLAVLANVQINRYVP
jgi:hypothetical protein